MQFTVPEIYDSIWQAVWTLFAISVHFYQPDEEYKIRHACIHPPCNTQNPTCWLTPASSHSLKPLETHGIVFFTDLPHSQNNATVIDIIDWLQNSFTERFWVSVGLTQSDSKFNEPIRI